MKYSSILLSLLFTGADAWVTTTASTASRVRTLPTALAAHNNNNNNKAAWSAAAAAGGWLLASQVAAAASLDAPFSVESPVASPDFPSTLLAAGAYVPESSFETSDMSMPSYTLDKNTDLMGLSVGGGSTSTTVKPDADPVKAAAQAEKAAVQAQKDAVARAAKAQKIAAAQAKMAAKKLERAAIQGKRASE